VTVDAMRSGLATEYFTERMLDGEGGRKDVKKPDVVWRHADEPPRFSRRLVGLSQAATADA
jgi:hypothetical protein